MDSYNLSDLQRTPLIDFTIIIYKFYKIIYIYINDINMIYCNKNTLSNINIIY